MNLDPDHCYEIVRARDRRFDGVFFVGVSTTGIYCRPVCPARTPGRDRCTFHADAATAERAGFRACLRCRPERAPGHAPVDAVSRLVRRAVVRIEGGALADGGVDALAATLGASGRHLRRVFEAELGVSPLAFAATRRIALARQLLRDTALPVDDVARASGYRSARAFRTAFRAHTGHAPSDVRRGRGPRSDELRVRLDARPPFDGRGVLAFLAGRGIPGVEHVERDTYTRSVRLGPHHGIVRVAVGDAGVEVGVDAALGAFVMQVVARVRRVFDLDARPDLVAERLGADPLLAAAVARRPGVRVPGAFDAFELAVRAVLGQQVSVKGATTLAGRLVARFGTPLATPSGAITHVFPTPGELAAVPIAEIRAVGMPTTRAETLSGLARAIDAGELELEPGVDPVATDAALRRIRGIGPWTAQYVGLRALGWPDAFPAGDLGVAKALGVRTAAQAEARAEPWRPWRAYAVMHLWTSLDGGGG